MRWLSSLAFWRKAPPTPLSMMEYMTKAVHTAQERLETVNLDQLAEDFGFEVIERDPEDPKQPMTVRLETREQRRKRTLWIDSRMPWMERRFYQAAALAKVALYVASEKNVPLSQESLNVQSRDWAYHLLAPPGVVKELQDQGYSLEDVARRLRVRTDFLQAVAPHEHP